MPARTDTGRPLRGAIIGWGGVARQAHLPGFLNDPRMRGAVEIVAVVDGDPKVPAVDGIRRLANREELAAVDGVDFIDICTPTRSHLDLTLWGLSRGYHVLCEKPVATNRAEASRIREAAVAAARVVAPCHQYRFNPVWMQIAAWLDAGMIGRWHLAELAVHRPGADPGAQTAATPWRGLRMESAGGVLLDHGTHLIYQMLDLAGLPSAVSAWVGRLRHASYDVEDTASALYTYPDRTVSMLLTWAGARRETLVRFTGDGGVIEWSGGELKLDGAGGTARLDVSADLGKDRYHQWFARLFDEFLGAIAVHDGQRYLTDIARVAAVLETTYAAADQRRTLSIGDAS